VPDRKLILDLCGGTGSWSDPYRERPDLYEVRLVDPFSEPLLNEDAEDVRLLEVKGLSVHGILAAPPCTVFSLARTRPLPNEVDFERALRVVDACCRIILTTRPTWWAIENPRGRLRRWLGDPALTFDPCDFGDPYTKKTDLWGVFNQPQREPVEPVLANHVRDMKGGRFRAKYRAMTPEGFARAFFEANP